MNTSNDFVNWVSKLGPDHTTVLQSFFVGTSQSDNYIKGQLYYGTGITSVAGKDWKMGVATMDSLDTGQAGVSSNDSLLVTANNGVGGGPLGLNLTYATYGGGAFIQGDGFAQFTANIMAFAGVNMVLNQSVTSDRNGDAVFLGVADDTQEITRIVYSITSPAQGFSAGDFAVDTFYLLNNPLEPQAPAPPPAPLPDPPALIPEPGTIWLLAGALLAFGVFRNRLAVRV